MEDGGDASQPESTACEVRSSVVACAAACMREYAMFLREVLFVEFGQKAKTVFHKSCICKIKIKISDFCN